MKAQVAPYQTLAYCLRIECLNGLVVRLTSYPRSLLMSNGNVYAPGNGYDFTGLITGTSFSPGAMDLEGIVAAGSIERDAVDSGVFDGARLYVFACSWLAPVEDYEPMTACFLGKTTLEDRRYRIEMMQIIDVLGQTTGKKTSPFCSKRFGGQEFAGCKVDLVPLTVAGTLTHVTSQNVFRDDARTEVEDWFGKGTIEFTTGPNVGLRPLEIKEYNADGTITTFEPAYYPVEVGHEYTMVPGCRKRPFEDCRDKYDNILNTDADVAMQTASQYGKVGGT